MPVKNNVHLDQIGAVKKKIYVKKQKEVILRKWIWRENVLFSEPGQIKAGNVVNNPLQRTCRQSFL